MHRTTRKLEHLCKNRKRHNRRARGRTLGYTDDSRWGPTCSWRGASISASGPHGVSTLRWCSKAVLGQRPGEEPVTVALEPEGGGYFAGLVADAGAGTLYRYRLDGEAALYPDPASRFQPDGPHGPSQVVDPGTFQWHDQSWRGVPLEGQVIYEMHLGTFTPEGTWEAASHELPALAELGVTVLEIMPIADFPGRFGWGYDGVDLFAPTRLYGTPDDCRRFMDRAHIAGLGVILDVVYNHVGPDGNVSGAVFSRIF